MLERQGDPKALDAYRQSFTIQRDFEPGIAAYALHLGTKGRLGEAESFLQGKRGELPNSAGVLAALGKKGTLINIARGSIVDEPALVAALQAGTIKGAGLDVFADEPRIPDALMQIDSVVLLPHVGSATRETRQAMGDLCKANLDAWFNEHRTLTLIPELA